MQITKLENNYALDSQNFIVDGVEFLLDGVYTDRFGNVIDQIKNLSNGKRSEMSRPRLVEVLVQAGYKLVKYGEKDESTVLPSQNGEKIHDGKQSQYASRDQREITFKFDR